MNQKEELSKSDIIELIDTLELYLRLVKDELPLLQEESTKISSNLQKLQTHNTKIENIGKLVKETNENFLPIQKELSQALSQIQEVKQLKQDYHSLKNRIIIAFALLGFTAGFAINHFLPF